MAKKRITKDEVAPKDIFGNVEDGAVSASDKVDILTASIVALKEAAKGIKKDIIASPKPKDLKSVEELEKLHKQANKTAQAKLQIDDKIIKEKLKLQQLNNERNKTLKQEIALEKTQIGSLKRLRIESKKLRDEKEDLNLTTAKGKKRLQEINKQLDRNNAILEKNATKLGKQKIGIGRYGNAIKTLRSQLGKLGLAFGAFTLLKNAFTVVRDFETAVADLSAVTGATGKDLDFLKDKALDFSAKFGQSAAEIAEAFKLAGSARPELLQNSEALADLTEKAIILSKASGDDVPTSIANLTGTLNAFELPANKAGEVMDTLANASLKGSKEIPFLTQAFTKFGGLAASSNVSISESAAAIESLGLKIPDAATAGVNFRNILLKLSAPETLPKKAIDDLERLGINTEILSDKTKPLNERLEELKPLLSDAGALTNVFGSQNVLAAQQLIGTTDIIGKNALAYGELGTAQDQMDVKSKTLGEAVNRLTAKWSVAMIKLADGTGAANGLSKGVDTLAKALDFVVDNIDSIIKVLGILTTAFIAFKVAMVSLNIAEKAKEWNKYRKELKQTGEAAQGATKGVKSFGKAIKAISFSVVIAAVIEFATALYDVASGAQRARYEMNLFNQSMNKGTAAAEGFITKNEEILQNKINEINLSKKSRAEKDKAIKQATKEAKLRTKEAIQALNESKEIAKQRKAAAQAEIEAQRKRVEAGKEGRTEQAVFKLTGSSGSLALLENKLANSRASIKGYNAALELLHTSYDTLGQTVIDQTIAEQDAAKATGNSTDEIDKQTKAIKANTFARLERKKAVTFEGLAEDISAQTDLDEKRERDIARLNLLKAELTGDEAKIAEAKIAQIAIDLDIETRLLKKGSLERIILEKEAAAKIAAIRQAEAERLTAIRIEQAEKTNSIIDGITQHFINKADERIAKIDEEIDAAKKQQDFLKQAAAEGNINAKESIAEQNKIIAQAEADRAKLERKKQSILLVSAVLQSFNANLAAGDDSTTAFAKAVASSEILTQFLGTLSNVPAFLDGTEDTGSNGSGVDGKGGFNAILHPNERVLTKEQNARIGKVSNNDLASIMEQHRLGEFTDGAQLSVGWDNTALVESLLSVEDKLDQVNKSIINKETNKIELGEIVQGAMMIKETVKKGATITNRRFKVTAK